jgi:hypothetical protein
MEPFLPRLVALSSLELIHRSLQRCVSADVCVAMGFIPRAGVDEDRERRAVECTEHEVSSLGIGAYVGRMYMFVR